MCLSSPWGNEPLITSDASLPPRARGVHKLTPSHSRQMKHRLLPQLMVSQAIFQQGECPHIQAAGFIPPLKLYESSWLLTVMFPSSVMWLVSKERRPAAATCHSDLPLAQELQAGGCGCEEPGFQSQRHRAWVFCCL